MTEECTVCTCDKDEPIAAIREDVAYIRGRIETMAATETRIENLENTARTQNIAGTIVAIGLAFLAWFKDS